MRQALLSEANFHLGGYSATEGFAGSAPLAVLEMIAYKSPDTRKIWGRWNTHVLDNGPPFLHWHPSDGDYFIVGDSSRFFERVRQLVNLLRAVASKLNRRLTLSRAKRNIYALKDNPIFIVNVAISGLSIPISFVQAPTSRNMKEVLDTFDIDIAKCYYDCSNTGYILVNSNVFECIRAGKARVYDIPVSENGPTAFETKKIASTIRRMNKYGDGERCYEFAGYPKFVIDRPEPL